MPGEATEWATFKTELGLEAMRQFLSGLAPNVGLLLEGEVGLTSHVADLARKAGRPTRVVHRKSTTPQAMLFDLRTTNGAEEEKI